MAIAEPANDHEARLSASDLIVRDILKGLYEGRYVAGQRLVEPDLVAQYQVSRSTVREAIKRLAAQGVVDAHHNRGARVRQLSVDEGRNILQIIEVIVGLAARLAALHIEVPGARQRLQDALQGICDASLLGEKFEFVRARNRFHREMTRMSGNPELEQMLINMQVHLVRNRLVMQPEERTESYRTISRAIFAGDAEAAETAARRHVRQMINLLDGVVEDAGLSSAHG